MIAYISKGIHAPLPLPPAPEIVSAEETTPDLSPPQITKAEDSIPPPVIRDAKED